ncbi:MAG TPA: histidine triad nucleotide-binding protein [Mycobacteriales bacterium]|jgi:histidine triad (HIT) family protein|nr:histidine triad nucleotide-binding protein [Mycobacteriales bacterium]
MSDCLFCRIVAGEVPADVVAQTDAALAFRDINPQAPTHVLVVPKEHSDNAAALARQDGELLAEVFRLAASVAEDEGLADAGYRLVTNTGDAAGQTVHHLHVHVLGGRSLGWPPG